MVEAAVALTVLTVAVLFFFILLTRWIVPKALHPDGHEQLRGGEPGHRA
jgi:hypothetical protein